MTAPMSAARRAEIEALARVVPTTVFDQKLQRALRDLLAELPKWQPIETAPKDGTEIIVAAEGYEKAIPAKWFSGWSEGQGLWVTAGYSQAIRCVPTHWQPLPEPPDA